MNVSRLSTSLEAQKKLSHKDENNFLHTTTTEVPFAYFHVGFILTLMELRHVVVSFHQQKHFNMYA